MFLHPSNIFFFIFLLLSIILITSSNSWLMVWLCLEINILMFIPLILKKSSKYQSEVAIKYFIVQAMASVLILLSFSELLMKFMNTYLLTLALFLKMAAAPLHMWMPSMVEGLSWQSFFILITAQKISPLLVLSLNFNTKMMELIFFIFIVSSAMVGSISGLTQSSLKKILTFSSISHLSWILTALMINKSLWVSYFFIYSLISLAIITTLKKNNTTKIAMLFKNKESNKSIILNFLSLGGLPPFTGFLPKLSVILSISMKSFSFLMLPLILGSLVSLFFYLRIAISTMFFSMSKPNNQVNHKPLNMDMSFFMNMTGLLGGLIIFLELLDFKLKKL